MRPLDYIPLAQSVSFQERLSGSGGWALKASVAACVLFGLFALSGLTLQGGGDLFFLFGGIAVFCAAVTAIFYVSAGTDVRLKRFAEANDMHYAHDASFDDRGGIIFGSGHSRTFPQLFTTTSQEFVEIGNYQYVTGSGKSRRVHNFGFMRIKLPRRLPNMVLDSKKNNFFGGRLSNLTIGFGKDQQLSLEGDFDRYFTLYAPAQYKTDALYVFTPDVMQALIDAAHAYDCEVIDDDFYIYSDSQFTLTDRNQLQELVGIASKLRPKLMQQTDYYADARVGDRSLNVVAPQGARLKTRLSFWTVMTIVVIVLVIIVRFYLMFTEGT